MHLCFSSFVKLSLLILLHFYYDAVVYIIFSLLLEMFHSIYTIGSECCILAEGQDVLRNIFDQAVVNIYFIVHKEQSKVLEQ
jgi:hypothetical protein